MPDTPSVIELSLFIALFIDFGYVVHSAVALCCMIPCPALPSLTLCNISDYGVGKHVVMVQNSPTLPKYPPQMLEIDSRKNGHKLSARSLLHELELDTLSGLSRA